MSARVVEVRIDELVLDGVGPLDRDRVASAATRELTRLLGERATWQGGRDAVDVTAADLDRAAKAPDDVGAAIGQAVHGQLTR